MLIPKCRCFYLVLLCILSQVAVADQIKDFPDIRNSFDISLQTVLERTLAQLELDPAVREKRLAVALVDITDLQRPRLAHVNGDEMMYAASLPKIGILLAALYEIQQGNLRLDKRMRNALTNMIRFSSNSDATYVMNRVGKYRVNRILSSDPFRLYDKTTNGGLWVGKEYGKKPAFQRDPLHQISHGATAFQVARFYYLLETGQLLSPELNRLMEEILSKPGINHKFVKGLAGRNVEIFRKSGTWRDWHADSAIVKAHGKTYIIVALVEDPSGGKWLTKLASSVHDALVPREIVGMISSNRRTR